MTPAPTTTHSTSSISSPRPRDQHHRKIGSFIGFNGGERYGALGRQGRVLDIDRAVEKTEPVQHPTHLCNMAAELDGERGGGSFVDPDGWRPRAHRKADRDLTLMTFDPGCDDRAGKAVAMLG